VLSFARNANEAQSRARRAFVPSEAAALQCGTKATPHAQHFKTAQTAQNEMMLSAPAAYASHAVVIGASAGGVAALLELTAALPKDLQAVVGMVLHVGSRPSILPDLLTARGGMTAIHPQEGQPLVPGTIYVAPPDFHMVFTPDQVRLSRGARENHARPAIDPLFRSTALAWRERAVGIVLTGELDDGTAGLAAIKACGGTTIVQDPATAVQASMPASALRNVPVDHCLPLEQIPAVVIQRVGRMANTVAAPPEQLQLEHEIFGGERVMENLSRIGQPSSLTCPACGGGLWEINGSKPLRYRCHTGHGFSARSLGNAQVEQAEYSLWSSLRALQEREILLRRLAMVAKATGDVAQAEAGQRQADRVRAQAELLSRLVQGEMNSA
jgi:two-component system, chemotaxis family, protein-glutamate methylesterase/glutaminase